MINLVKADLYKIIRSKSFKLVILLIVFVSVLSVIVLNRNIDINREKIMINPVLSKTEYKSVNKYGSYKQYISRYKEYEEIVNKENKKINKNKLTASKSIINNLHNFLFVLGVVVIYFSFSSFSYDYQKDTIRYLFMSKNGRNKIYFSKIISCFLLIIFFELLLIFIMCISTSLLTMEILSFETILYVLKQAILYFIPLMFISIFSLFLSILLKGNILAFLISFVVYFSSLLFSQILFNYGLMFVKYTFLPYVDFTYLNEPVNVALNNIIYNLNFNYLFSSKILIIYSLIFMFISLRFLKRDV